MPRVSRFTPLGELPAVVLDSETTGLDVTTCRLVQISAVRVLEGKVRHEQTFDRLVNPEMPIPPTSTTVHGITDEMVADAPTFAQIKPDLDAFLGEAVLVGQSVGFDLAVLLRETQLTGLTWRQPQFLDTKLLAAALDPDKREFGLDALAARLGVPITDRHQALGDALVTAEIFARLLPRLAEAGVRTLGDAEARSNAQTRIRARHADQGWYDSNSLRPPDAFESGNDAPSLQRLDTFAYRYRLEHVMSPAPVVVAPATPLIEAIRLMAAGKTQSVIAGDPGSGRIDGIVTQTDVVNVVARAGAEGLVAKLEEVMTSPVATMPPDAFVYRALARMQRLGISQLPVADANGRILGMLSLRDLLREEAPQAVVLGDRMSTAASPRALAAARSELPGLARQLLGDDVGAPEVATVIAAELRELLARATVLAEKRMEAEGAGRPPVPYAVLALGRVGRGECLVDTELEHAIVFASGDAGGFEAQWFTTFGDHLCEVLRAADAAVQPGRANAADPTWRRSLEDWRLEVARWALEPDSSTTNAARFFDFRLAYGDADLADDLRRLALETAAASPRLARALAPQRSLPMAEKAVDLAAAGLVPIEAAARALAVAAQLSVVSTAERLSEACSHTGLSRQTADELTELHETLLGVLLAQQSRDGGSNGGSRQIELDELETTLRAEVQAALARAAHVDGVVRMALALV
jgi:CBS domain-containing protein